MKNKLIIRCAAVCMAVLITIGPVNASAATMIRIGSKGSDVVAVQTNLKNLGYLKTTKVTGYYGSITKAAVKRFQKDNKIAADGIVGKKTMNLLNTKATKNTNSKIKVEKVSDAPVSSSTSKVPAASGNLNFEDALSGDVSLESAVSDGGATDTGTASSAIFLANPSALFCGALDWFKDVRYIWYRGQNAVVTDVETGLSFKVKRTYGTNHADVEPLTKEDTAVVKKIWRGFSWERRAVIVQLGNYTLAGSMTGMPHAGVDSKPANITVSGRSAGYGRGINYDTVKNNGCNGHMDIHFKNSKTHSTNRVLKSQHDMVKKAASFINVIRLMVKAG